MRYLKKYNESKSNDIVEEILSNPGWEKKDPPSNENWNIELRYHIKDDIFIDVLNFKRLNGLPLKDFPYYIRKGKIHYYVSSYSSSHTNLFSEYDTIYRDLSDYDRMMKICNYLIPYFDREPSDDLIEDIKDCFLEINDELSISPEIVWGYCNENGEYGFFPAYSFSDSLCLCLIYEHNRNIDFNKIEEEFNLIKERLESLDIHTRSRVSIIDDNWRVIIKIKF